MSEWQSIESAPRDREILVCFRDTETRLVVFWDEDNAEHPWSTLDGPSYRKDAFSGWQPLPAAPKPGDAR